MATDYTNSELQEFLSDLDSSTQIEVAEEEEEVIEKLLDRDSYSRKERQKILDLMGRYGKRLGWEVKNQVSDDDEED